MDLYLENELVMTKNRAMMINYNHEVLGIPHTTLGDVIANLPCGRRIVGNERQIVILPLYEAGAYIHCKPASRRV